MELEFMEIALGILFLFASLFFISILLQMWGVI